MPDYPRFADGGMVSPSVAAELDSLLLLKTPLEAVDYYLSMADRGLYRRGGRVSRGGGWRTSHLSPFDRCRLPVVKGA